jgi:hypothetical protein
MNIRTTPPVGPPLASTAPVRPPASPALPATGSIQASRPGAGPAVAKGTPGVGDTLTRDEQLFFERMFASDSGPLPTVSGYRREGNRPQQGIGTVIDRRG